MAAVKFDPSQILGIPAVSVNGKTTAVGQHAAPLSGVGVPLFGLLAPPDVRLIKCMVSCQSNACIRMVRMRGFVCMKTNRTGIAPSARKEKRRCPFILI